MRFWLSLFILFLLFFGCSSQTIQDDNVNKTIKQNQTKNLTEKIKNDNINSTLIEVPCNENHSSMDIFNPGLVQKAGKLFINNCINDTVVQEFYCNSTQINSQQLDCPKDYLCRQGACIKKLLYCIDNQNAQVTAGGKIYSDVCVNADFVKHYYCQDDIVQVVLKNCPITSKCQNGACTSVLQTCTESANRSDNVYYANVTVVEASGISYILQNKCEDIYTLVKYYCAGSVPQSQRIACIRDRGEECIKGTCQKPRSCEDSHDKINNSTKGTVKTIERFDIEDRVKFYDDTCISSYSLRKYYCNNDSVAYQDVSCQNSCQDGLCK